MVEEPAFSKWSSASCEMSKIINCMRDTAGIYRRIILSERENEWAGDVWKHVTVWLGDYMEREHGGRCMIVKLCRADHVFARRRLCENGELWLATTVWPVRVGKSNQNRGYKMYQKWCQRIMLEAVCDSCVQWRHGEEMWWNLLHHIVLV